ncbi:hypothetical protein IQ269_15430 [Tychonema sp. LEGE 07199]|uniref:hypothetical protein n=1 Tax=unclassified Tychonema TaxID=2642144 RepID=UPI00187FA93C|nr:MULTISPECIES: hypothetical protein [unclassified Tychonema]MBE9122158.1 hypothetical protein [Tychonema sp. LEGE 07199]MBE9134321.1 hypothetical protein [Tychonema sp. LEGE 07196]
MPEAAKAEEAPKPAPLTFKGVCKDGVLKGKEVEGLLDIKINVLSVKSPEAPAPKKSQWEAPIFWVVFLLTANFAVGDPAGLRNYSSPQRPHSHEMLNQSGEQSLLPKKNTSNLPL